MKTILFYLLFSLTSFSSYAMTMYKVSVNAINLYETGDFDFWGYKGEIMIYMESENGYVPFFIDPIQIADNEGRVSFRGLSSDIFIPINFIEDNKAILRFKVVDIDEEYSDEILNFKGELNIKNSLSRVTAASGEYLEFSVKKVEINDLDIPFHEFQSKSLNIQKLMAELNFLRVYTVNSKENSEAIRKGAETYRRFYEFKEEILRCKGGDNYIKLVKSFNKKVLEDAGETITATAWINEDFPALPNATSLLIGTH